MSDVIKLTNCPDCGAEPGEQHQFGCDVARCTATGEQFIQCEGELHTYHGREYGEHVGICQPTIWTGEWPGNEECRELGLWCYWGPPWTPCDADHPGAVADLNTLTRMAMNGKLRWDGQRWQAIEEQGAA